MFKQLNFYLQWFLILTIVTSNENNYNAKFTLVKSDLHGVIFQYFGESHSEKLLPMCVKNSVCSIVHNRFWLWPIVTRLCRCSSGFDCSWQTVEDANTMELNNRATFKFCEPVVNNKKCHRNEIATTVESYQENNKLLYDNPPKATINCYCPSDNYWKHWQRLEQSFGTNSTIRVVNFYKCKPLKQCRTNEFCGHVRSDYFSTYYVCSCPTDHMCLYKDSNLTKADELFYQGPAFRAHCFENK